jgi:ribulose-5-phosphate 4-epimerase/fuculose-1-phosphate aldolase
MQRGMSEVKSLVAEAGRVLHALGLVDYLGHVSTRLDDGRIVIKPKHSPTVRSLGGLSAEDMVIVDAEGNLLDGADKPPAEVYIHTEIYKARPDVRAVAHTHQHSATLLGVIEQPALPLLHIPASYVDVDEVGLWPSSVLVTDVALGADLAAALGDRDYCHLQGHGIVSVGATVEEAVIRAVMLEDLSRANLDVLATGKPPRLIPQHELDELRKHRAPVAGRWEYFREIAAQISS